MAKNSVWLISLEVKTGGHSPAFLGAWENFLKTQGVPFSMCKIPTSTSGSYSTTLQRLIRACKDGIRGCSTWLKLLRHADSDTLFLFLDAPSSQPFGFRVITRFMVQWFLETRTFIICHAYPQGGDERPEVGNFNRYKNDFRAQRVFVHSENLQDFLIQKVGLASAAIKSFSWGCSRIKKVSSPPSGSLKILFMGQYRSSKGLEWLWKELQSLHCPSNLIAAISCQTSVATAILDRLNDICEEGNVVKIKFQHSSYYSEDEVTSLFQEVDLLMIPYLPTHSLVSGLVYLAAEHGCPVISSTHSESGFLPEKHGFGFSFTPGDGDGMRKQIERYVNLPGKEKLQMRASALIFAEEHSWNRVLGEVWKTIKKDVSHRGH